MLDKQLQAALDSRRKRGVLRELTVFPTSSTHVRPDLDPSSSSMVDFSSNDYLSLASSSRMRESFLKRLGDSDRWPLGSTGSRLLDGNSKEHEMLEIRLAAHFHSPSALLFNSGYDANVSLFSVLPQPGDVVVYDELVHASVHDGLRKSRAGVKRSFRHNDVSDLERVLEELTSTHQDGTRKRDSDLATKLRQGKANLFLALESVYSMDGDVCPLVEVIETLERYIPRDTRHVIVDEAHGTAVYGPGGRGVCAALGVEHRVRVRLATFGKAMGTSGAVVLCNSLIRHYLINYARPLIFSTALAHPMVIAIDCALDALQNGDAGRRSAALLDRTQLLIGELSTFLDPSTRDAVALSDRQGKAKAQDESAHNAQHSSVLDSSPAPRFPSPGDPILSLPRTIAARHSAGWRLPASPIVPLLTPHARALAAHLRGRGFLVRSICYPTVPRGQDRVRICVHAGNAEAEVRALVSAVQDWYEERLQGAQVAGRTERDRKVQGTLAEAGQDAAQSTTVSPSANRQEPSALPLVRHAHARL